MSENWKVSGKKFAIPSGIRQELEARPGGWVIFTDAQGARHRMMMSEGRGTLSASLGGTLYLGAVSSDHVQGSARGGGDSDLVSQFPGKVRKVLVGEGVEVSENDPLILVEAMKMEFTIKAPFSGKVAKILVKEGQQLSPGDRFLELEPK